MLILCGLLAGWASWIRTSGMRESKSRALPLGDGPLLQNGKSACEFAVPDFKWGGRWDSNPRQPEPQSGALPTELHPPYLVRPKGLEPLAHCLEGSCSIHLSYKRKLQHPLLERVMGIEPTRPAWKAGILPLNYTRRCNGHYYSQTGANCQGILKNFFLFQCPFPKCVFILYHILHQDAREISQKSFVFPLRFSR